MCLLSNQTRNPLPNPLTLDEFASHLSLHLAGDYLQLGSVIGHSLASTTPEINATIITHLLAAGFAYVCAPGGKVRESATCHATPPHPTPR